ncbi:DUF2237 family protein [Pseudonocardia benzenivorans]|uniref:DUF2237 family protein n=1 Tax=Pseudonocardia benzenivorans TaxID=228005 RepID=A0ABW3VGY8_9PSEU
MFPHRSGPPGVNQTCHTLSLDLSTPRPEWGFAGLRPGDRWCLCADRWAEAHRAGVAPPVVLEATHARTLEWVDLADLQAHAAT